MRLYLRVVIVVVVKESEPQTFLESCIVPVSGLQRLASLLVMGLTCILSTFPPTKTARVIRVFDTFTADRILEQW